VLLLPPGSTRHTLLTCLREHLPYPDLWDIDKNRLIKFKSYVNICNRLAKEIREDGESWPYIKVLGEFEHPLIYRIAVKQLRSIIDFTDAPQTVQPQERIEWTVMGETLLATFPTRVWGIPHWKNLPRTRAILLAKRPMEYVPLYEDMCSRFLDGISVNELLGDFLELDSIRDRISNMLDEIMIRCGYLTHTCRLCPQQS
jgi:hypothetical protein